MKRKPTVTASSLVVAARKGDVSRITAIKDATQLDKDIYAFCPDAVDQGTETVQKLAGELKGTRRLFLWWD